MKTKKAKILLHRFFEGETTLEEEQMLESYFQSEMIDDELLPYKSFFGGIAEIAQTLVDSGIEDEIMDHILEQEHREKTKYRWMWQRISGVAVAVVIIFGGLLIYEQQNKQPFKDTFSDPDEAYAYATQTLKVISSKYNSGIVHLAHAKTLQSGLKPLKQVKKLDEASTPLQKGITAVNKGFSEVNSLEKYNIKQ